MLKKDVDEGSLGECKECMFSGDLELVSFVCLCLHVETSTLKYTIICLKDNYNLYVM